ncbi:MAG TPA: sigma-70 family RNA polymerase sigma factor [Rhizomicrobium sp.]|nr:sigma-70 family RNA polymerase sigma factor [Rhizomicrobium sp.]
MGDTDDALVLQVARGDRLAFARLVERHGARLMALAVRIVGNRAVAEEIVQETFTRAWTQAPKWRQRGETARAFAAWLSRVTTNLAIDQMRKPRTSAIEDAPEPEDPATDAVDTLIAREKLSRLQAALAQLPPRQRAAIALTYDQGLSNIEGAAALETSVGAFELLLVRARRALRIAMTEDEA